MNIRALLGILTVRILHFGIRLVRRGGTDFPGRIALKICPNLLSALAKNVRTVAITGTNGKTTSARIVEQAFADSGIDCIANRSGANLLSGITTEFAMHYTLTGKCKSKWAVIECDEAAARRTFAQLQPEVVLVTNLFRDQLDRYGEVTHTLENIREGLKSVPNALLCLNADCSLTSSLAGDLPNKAVFYGVERTAAGHAEPPEISDATHCIRCRTHYEYDYVTYGHLGGYRCPSCGYRRPAPDVAVTAVDSLDSAGSRIRIRLGENEQRVRVNLPAMYNIYNAAGSITAATAMGLSAESAVSAVGSFHCGFGRMERFDIGQKGAEMMLVKNPAGFDQVLEFLSDMRGDFDLVMFLNDNSADGTDVSWIWDACFEKLSLLGDRLHSVTVSGIRASDLWVRLKYAGVSPEKISLERDYEALTQKISKMDKPVYIVPTYTAMLDFRACLIKHCGGSDFWEG